MISVFLSVPRRPSLKNFSIKSSLSFLCLWLIYASASANTGTNVWLAPLTRPISVMTTLGSTGQRHDGGRQQGELSVADGIERGLHGRDLVGDLGAGLLAHEAGSRQGDVRLLLAVDHADTAAARAQDLGGTEGVLRIMIADGEVVAVVPRWMDASAPLRRPKSR